jgi:hypothetical protein
MQSPVNPNDIHGGDWELVEITPEYRRSRLWLDDGNYILRTEYIQDEELIALNQQEFNDSLTKRFNDSALGTKVASIPVNVFYRDIAPRLKEGDQDYMKWFLNHPDKRMYRTFRGKV